jgi:hypothetical protein
MDFDFSGFAPAFFGGLSFELPVHQVLPDYFHNDSMRFNELWQLTRNKGSFILL